MASHAGRCLSLLTLVVSFILSQTSAQAATVAWTGASGVDKKASTAGNWDLGVGPSSTDDVVINATSDAIVWDATAPATVQSLTLDVGFTGTLTLTGSFASSTTLTINSGILLTAKDAVSNLSAGTALNIGAAGMVIARRSSIAGNGLGQTVSTASLTIDAGGSLNADAQGFDGNTGPGAGLVSGVGGSYGGRGASISVANAPGNLYGSATAPVALGSGGRDSVKGVSAGKGGGAIKLIITDAITVNGTLSADGGNAPYPYGGGSGGSIWIVSGFLSGSGSISAKGGEAGGTGPQGGGGGGRIDLSGTVNNFSGTLSVLGGTQARGSSRGRTGTILFPHAQLQNFTVSQNLSLGNDISYTFGALTITNNAVLTFDGDPYVGTTGTGATVSADSVTIDAGAVLSVDAQGFGSGYLGRGGPGTGAYSSGGSGAGHGGSGGATAVPGGNPYGSVKDPLALGSAGGASTRGIHSAGGGALRLNVAGTLTVNGAISANSAPYVSPNGTGAGGSLNISAATLSGTGIIRANAANSSYGSGAGGRIAVKLTASDSFPLTLQAFGGAAGNKGAAGTIYLEGADGKSVLTINNQNTATAAGVDTRLSEDLSVSSLVLQNGGKLDVAIGSTLSVSGNVTVNGGAHSGSLSLAGDWLNTGAAARAGVLVLAGANQTIRGDNIFAGLSKQVTTSATLSFEAGKLQRISGLLTLSGAQDNLLSLRSTLEGKPARLALESLCAVCQFVDVKDSDAREGLFVVAAPNCVDRGNNLNWLFGVEGLVNIFTPASSVTNPAWVEGAAAPGLDSLTVAVNGGESFTPTRLNSIHWFADNNSNASVSPALGITLSEQTPTSVTVTAAKGVNYSTMTQELVWTPTNLAETYASSDLLTIRQGDALLYKSSAEGSVLTIDANGDSAVDFTGTADAQFAYRYSTPGTFVATAKVDGKEVGSLLVVVLAVDLSKPVACEVNYEREKDVVITPSSQSALVTFMSADPKLLSVSLKGPMKSLEGNGVTLKLKALVRGRPVLLARVGSTQGPIITLKEIDEFTVDVPAMRGAIVNGSTDTGMTALILRPYIPNLRFTLKMFAHTATFAGGLKSLSVNTSDTDPLTGQPLFLQQLDPKTNEVVGIYTINLEVPPTETLYCFTVQARQSASREVTISAPANVNGKIAKVVAPTPLSFDHETNDEKSKWYKDAAAARQMDWLPKERNNGQYTNIQDIEVWESAARILAYKVTKGNPACQFYLLLTPKRTFIKPSDRMFKDVLRDRCGDYPANFWGHKPPETKEEFIFYPLIKASPKPNSCTEFPEIKQIDPATTSTPIVATEHCNAAVPYRTGIPYGINTLGVFDVNSWRAQPLAEIHVARLDADGLLDNDPANETLNTSAAPLGRTAFPDFVPVVTDPQNGKYDADTPSLTPCALNPTKPGLKPVEECLGVAARISAWGPPNTDINVRLTGVKDQLRVSLTGWYARDDAPKLFRFKTDGNGLATAVIYLQSPEPPPNADGTSGPVPTGPLTLTVEGEEIAWACASPGTGTHFEKYCSYVLTDEESLRPIRLELIDYLPRGNGTTGDLSHDNPHMGGYRFFPDAESYATRTQSRNKVRVRAKITPAIPNYDVYLRLFDVDDPSANEVIDSNGYLGVDNRGTLYGRDLELPGSSVLDPSSPLVTGSVGSIRPIHNGVTGPFARPNDVVKVKTTAAGYADVELATTFSPGDNFRVAASLSKGQLKNLHPLNGVPTVGHPTGFSGRVTEQLMVWRHLNIEVDSMTAVPMDYASKSPDRTIFMAKSIVAGPDPGQSTIRTSSALEVPVDFYYGGYIEKDGVKYRIVGNTSGYLSDDIIVEGTPTGANAWWLIRDDDDNGLPASWLPSLPRLTNLIGALARSKYVPACIDLREAPDPNPDRLVPFVTNEAIDAWTGTVCNNAKNLSSSPMYWTHLLTVAYQPGTGDDRDPNSEAPEMGATLDTIGTSAVYLESIREYCAITNIPANVLQQQLEGTIAHEIGHQPGGVDDHPEYGLMGEGKTDGDFQPRTIRRFRCAVDWYAH